MWLQCHSLYVCLYVIILQSRFVATVDCIKTSTLLDSHFDNVRMNLTKHGESSTQFFTDVSFLPKTNVLCLRPIRREGGAGDANAAH